MREPTVILDKRNNKGYRATFQTEGGRWCVIHMKWNGSQRKMVGSGHAFFDSMPDARRLPDIPSAPRRRAA